ncbi:MAG: hypothetical protein ACT4QG_02810 [Sporichthyaceae bacterium]
MSQTEQLISTLKDLTAHLRAHDEPTWADALTECRFLIEDDDPRGLPRLLHNLASEGGLNDLALRVPHDESGAAATVTANDRLRALMAEAGGLAQALPVPPQPTKGPRRR